MSERVKIALGQIVVTSDRDKNREKGASMVAEAAKAGAGLIAFPEMSFEPFFPQHPTNPAYFDWAEPVPGPTSKKFARLAKQHDIEVLINLFQTVERGQYFDATVVCGADGEIAGFTQMMHICETPGFHEKYYYWPGTTEFPVFDFGLRVGPCICYDRHFPEVMRILTMRGADVIVVQTATSEEEAGGILETEMQAAALANGVFIALVNRAGHDQNINFAGRSFVVDPRGKIIAQSETNEDDILLADLDLGCIARARHEWPFLRDRRPEIYGDLMMDMEDLKE